MTMLLGSTIIRKRRATSCASPVAPSRLSNGSRNGNVAEAERAGGQRRQHGGRAGKPARLVDVALAQRPRHQGADGDEQPDIYRDADEQHGGGEADARRPLGAPKP